MASCFSTNVSTMIHAPDIWTNNAALFMKVESVSLYTNPKSVQYLWYILSP